MLVATDLPALLQEEVKNLLAIRTAVGTRHLLRVELHRPDGEASVLHGLDHPVCIPGGAVEALPQFEIGLVVELLTVISVPYRSPSMVMIDRRMG